MCIRDSAYGGVLYHIVPDKLKDLALAQILADGITHIIGAFPAIAGCQVLFYEIVVELRRNMAQLLRGKM